MLLNCDDTPVSDNEARKQISVDIPRDVRLGDLAPRPSLRRMLASLARHLRTPAHLPGVIWKNLKFPFTPQAAEVRYDRLLGIDTAGNLEPNELGINGARDGSSWFIITHRSPTPSTPRCSRGAW